MILRHRLRDDRPEMLLFENMTGPTSWNMSQLIDFLVSGCILDVRTSKEQAIPLCNDGQEIRGRSGYDSSPQGRKGRSQLLKALENPADTPMQQSSPYVQAQFHEH